MTTPAVRYCSNVTESTGYAQAARNLVASLITARVDVSVEVLRIDGAESEQGPGFDRLIRPCIGKENYPTVRIVHTNPTLFERYRQHGVWNIGCTVWETDKLPQDWVEACNQMDEIWVPCRWNVEVFGRSGVTVPVRFVPHAIDVQELHTPSQPLALAGLPQDVLLFYSIFQWSPRKNPEGLIKAYLAEFEPSDRVCLLIKSYLSSHSSAERFELAQRVQHIKTDMGMEGEPTPPIALLSANLGRAEMLGLHRLGDCLVLPHRSEGWGLPLLEAMSLGKPVIATAFGGCLEFMTPDNSYLLDCQRTPVCGMPWYKPYRGDQMWAEPDLAQLRRILRHVYQEPREARCKGQRAAQDARAFSWGRVGEQVREILVSGRNPSGNAGQFVSKKLPPMPCATALPA